MHRILLIAILSYALAACSMNTGRYQQAHDSTPTRLPSNAELKDAVPRAEPKSRGGNKRYTVRGKTYQVLDSAKGFSETGIASWYGKKFHGHLTSNGEIYDMYGMSAAHKNLPLPTYVRVTNLSNNRSVVVRVNDRGPFHPGRVIDLSYSAAYKIGMLKTGTAQVKVEAITDFTPQKPSTSSQTASNTEISVKKQAGIYVQVFATKDANVAKTKAKALSALLQKTVSYPHSQGIYRLQVGPFLETENVDHIIKTLEDAGYPNAYRRKILQ